MAGFGNTAVEETEAGMTTREDVRPDRDPAQTATVEDDDDENPNVSPDEQERYEAVVKEGLALIYEGGEVRPGIVQMLDENPEDLMGVLGNIEELQDFSPTVALAATTVIVMLEVVRRAGDSKPDGDIILHAGKAILEELADMATDAGIHDYSQDEINQAMLMGMDLYREAAADEGLVDLQALKDEFDEIVTADKQGRIGELLPGIERFGAAEETEDGRVRNGA